MQIVLPKTTRTRTTTVTTTTTTMGTQIPMEPSGTSRLASSSTSTGTTITSTTTGNRGIGTRAGSTRPTTTRLQATTLGAAATTSSSEWNNDDSTQPLLSPVELHPNEPNLHCIPKELYPSYRSLPLFINILTFLLSAWTSAVTTWKQLTWFQPLAILSGMRPTPSVKEWILFAIKTLLFTVLSQTLIQDIFLPPTRISTETLQRKYCLPSPLSNYEQITVPLQPHNNNNDNNNNNNPSSFTLGVHYLLYENDATAVTATTHTQTQTQTQQEESKSFSFDALYVLHGFGASSLSWLPPLPALVQKLNAAIGIGHDAVGFGFTDRPMGNNDHEMSLYTTRSSAMIGTQLLKNKLLGASTVTSTSNDEESILSSPPSPTQQQSVAIFGHSLGSLTALKMALRLPRETSKLIVLVAPALGIRRTTPSNSTPPPQQQQYQPLSWWKRTIVKPTTSLFRKTIIYPVGGYALRRAVGTNNFWKTGLQSVWGDPKGVKDSDALRFQWPSIGAGWERGLLNFAFAQGRRQRPEEPNQVDDDADDVTLLRQVLNLPNTTVAIVLGSKDKVIPTSLTQRFLQEGLFLENNNNNNLLPVITMNGCGHDPFEEDVDAFSNVIEKILEEYKTRNV